MRTPEGTKTKTSHRRSRFDGWLTSCVVKEAGAVGFIVVTREDRLDLFSANEDVSREIPYRTYHIILLYVWCILIRNRTKCRHRFGTTTKTPSSVVYLFFVWNCFVLFFPFWVLSWFFDWTFSGSLRRLDFEAASHASDEGRNRKKFTATFSTPYHSTIEKLH
jgi:hypothetical protein